jgi:aldehyde dehydrogenase (NAD+)
MYDNIIAGISVAPQSGRYFDNLNPADQTDVVGCFADSGVPDVDAAVKAAQVAFPAWAAMPAPKRAELIVRAAEIMKSRKDELAAVILREMGKTMPECQGDIQSSIDVAYFSAGEGRRLYGQTTHSALANRAAYTRRFPVGVCGLITAWNAPMAIVTWKLFPALVCGNTCVVKPSEDTPLTAYLLAGILKEAGFPDGVANFVFGAGPVAGKALTEHRDVALVSFTGSSGVGSSIAEVCGRQLKRCSLELGGKNGLVVMPDADLAAAAKAVAAGAFSTAGQRCASTSRVFVHMSVKEVFMKFLLAETAVMKVGPGSDPTTKVCPVISRRQYDRILAAIALAKKAGARCIIGGNALTEGCHAKGLFIEPTIFDDVDPASALAREEIFGPVLAVFSFSDFDEAVAKMNDCEYGLTGSIYTADVNTAMTAIDRFAVGCCYVNGPTFGSEPHMPFGGLKKSGGIGTREPGTQAMDVFSEWKTVYVDYSGGVQNSQYAMKK